MQLYHSRVLELLVVAALVASARTADVPSQDFSSWSPAGPGDVRSPCPGLNTLANHGFLPHNGKAITLKDVESGMVNGMNTDATLAAVLFAGALLATPDPLLGTFDLNDLDQHNFPIEHDASLSRGDAFFGNDYSFNQTIFDSVLSFYDGMANTSIPVASHAKYSRVLDSERRNPQFTYGPREYVLSYGETALYLSILGDPITGVAPVDWVKILFEQERLPYKEGWRPPKTPTTLVSLAAMSAQLESNCPDALPEGLRALTVGTLQDAWEGINPVTEVLGNLTCALAGC